MGRIELQNLNNTRDLGGIVVSDGRIREGKLIRSGLLGEASRSDMQWIKDNVSTIIDFRSGREIWEAPDPFLIGVGSFNLPIIDDLAAGVSRDSKSDEEAIDLLTVNPGSAEGMLVGGNLSLIAGTIGTPYEIDTKDRILFIEEIGERTYCVDRMLTQLRLAGKFEDCAGIVFGDFNDCPVEYPEFGLTLEEVIHDVAATCGKPVFTGLQAGHVSPKLTLPFGVRCRMDADACTLEVLESAVLDA